MQNDNIDEIIDGIKSQKSKKGAEKFLKNIIKRNAIIRRKNF